MNIMRFVVVDEANNLGPGVWRVRITHNLGTRDIMFIMYDDEGFMHHTSNLVLDTPDMCTLFFDHDPIGLTITIFASTKP